MLHSVVQSLDVMWCCHSQLQYHNVFLDIQDIYSHHNTLCFRNTIFRVNILSQRSSTTADYRHIGLQCYLNENKGKNCTFSLPTDSNGPERSFCLLLLCWKILQFHSVYYSDYLPRINIGFAGTLHLPFSPFFAVLVEHNLSWAHIQFFSPWMK